ncbi:MAG: HDOD domain-containing protein [Planctomycetota bacterium]|nr:HDOD domain-containing protein [Planctomycetota bacterium]MCX8039048.1 HDOD domain-containing protein [Planctomycetota bacterium]MDW8372698.1 HDOD domain-containing protein [Planctomycetota bacterium]
MPLSPATIAARLLSASMPTLPSTLAQLERVIAIGDTPPRIVIDILGTDPALTALVIGQANAAGCATHRLSEAVVHNGLGTVLTTARCALPVTGAEQALIKAFWAQAYLVSHLVVVLAAVYRHRLRLAELWDEEALRVAGLIHDLVAAFVAIHFPEAHARAVARCRSAELALPEALAEELGMPLPELAQRAAQTWSLPEPLAAVLGRWREPSSGGPYADICALVQVAHVLTRAIGFGPSCDRFVPAFDDWAVARLELRLGELQALVDRAFAIADDLAL